MTRPIPLGIPPTLRDAPLSLPVTAVVPQRVTARPIDGEEAGAALAGDAGRAVRRANPRRVTADASADARPPE